MSHIITNTPNGAECSCGQKFVGGPLQGSINFARSNGRRHAQSANRGKSVFCKECGAGTYDIAAHTRYHDQSASHEADVQVEKNERDRTQAAIIRDRRRDAERFIREGRTDKQLALSGVKDEALIAELRAELDIPNPPLPDWWK